MKTLFKTIAGLLVSATLFAPPSQSLAAPLYKCEVDGTLAFQDSPCPPLKAKQKVACADVEGFAVYQDALGDACNNLPAGTPKSYDVAGKKSTSTAKSAKASGKTGHLKKAGKDVIVRAYTKEDGTQVPSHTRSLPGDKVN